MCYVLHGMYTIQYSSIQYTVLVYRYYSTLHAHMHICISVRIPGTTPYRYGVTGISSTAPSPTDTSGGYAIHVTYHPMPLGTGNG